MTKPEFKAESDDFLPVTLTNMQCPTHLTAVLYDQQISGVLLLLQQVIPVSIIITEMFMTICLSLARRKPSNIFLDQSAAIDTKLSFPSLMTKIF